MADSPLWLVRTLPGLPRRASAAFRFGWSSQRWISPSQLDDLHPPIAGDQPAATGGRRRRPHVPDQRALLWTARQQKPRSREVAQGLDDRLVEPSRRSTGAAGDDQMKSDVPGQRQQGSERLYRRALRGGDQVVVVDHDEDLGAGPPGPPAQLFGCDV